MKFTALVTFDIDTADWASEFDLAPAEAAADVADVLTRAASDGGIAQAITKEWPMMRDAATVTVSPPGKALDALIDGGLTFSDCVKAFAARQDDPNDVVGAARDQYQDEGSVEIDDNAIISDSDEGAYVMAWVWVDKDGDEDDDEDEHEDGDGCASYDTGYQVLTRDGRTVGVEDLREGDEYRDPATDGEDQWYPVTGIYLVPDGVTVDVYQVASSQTVHVASSDDSDGK